MDSHTTDTECATRTAMRKGTGERRSFPRWLYAAPLLLAGCLTPGHQPWFARRPLAGGNNPDHSAGGALPGGAPQTVRKPSPSRGRVEPLPSPQKSSPKHRDENQGGKATPGPRFPKKGERLPEVTLQVTAPQSVQRDGFGTWTAVVRNVGRREAENLTLQCRLDPDLRFPEQTTRHFFRSLPRLAPGEAQRVTLMLQPRGVGKRCAEFSVRFGQRELIWKAVCTEVVQPLYRLELNVPPRRSVGSRLEPTLTLTNLSGRTLKNLQLVVLYDAEKLRAWEATGKPRHTPGRLLWNIGLLKPQQRLVWQVDLQALRRDERACLSAEISGPQLPADMRVACLRVTEPAGSFDMRIADTRDLLKTGEQTDLIVSVLNRAKRPLPGEVLQVIVPENFRLLSASVWEKNRRLAAKATVKEGMIRFDAVPQHGQNEELVYRLRVQAVRAGRGEFRAVLRPANNSAGKPLLQLSESTTVVR